jgi:hypothetical protein
MSPLVLESQSIPMQESREELLVAEWLAQEEKESEHRTTPFFLRMTVGDFLPMIHNYII